MTNGTLYGVALGPGDPELITVKGLNALMASDVIYYPGSISKDGEKSFSLDILKHYQLPNAQFKGVYLPMSLDRTLAESVYSQAFEDVLEDYRQGKTVSFVAEGDISFYSTFAYLIDRIHGKKLNFIMIPGVPAFILAGSKAQIPITKQDESLLVLSQCASIESLRIACATHASVVLMKPTTLKSELIQFLTSFGGSFVYAEKMGTVNEFITADPNELAGRTIPYFSVLIFRQ